MDVHKPTPPRVFLVWPFNSWDWLFVASSVITLSASVALMLRSPVVWLDEVQLADFARTLLAPGTHWSLAHLPDGTPALSLNLIGMSYLAGFLEVFGYSMVVVRTAGVVSGMILASTFYWLLRILKVDARSAAWLGLALMCDTVFSQSIRGCRLDALACSSVLLAIVFWYKSWNSIKPGLMASVSGIFAASAIFIWPTAAVLLGGYAVFCLRSWRQDSAKFWRLLLMAGLSAICLSAIVAGALIGLLGWDSLKANMFFMRHIGGDSITFGADQIKFLAKFIAGSPISWFCIIVLFRVGWGRDRRVFTMASPVVASLLICLLMPPLYIWRLVYVIPLLYLFAVEGLTALNWNTRIFAPAIALLLVAYSVVGRALKTLPAWQSRGYSQYSEKLAAVIPKGATVYGSVTLYYAALKNDWKLFSYTVGGVPSKSLSCRFEYLGVENFPVWLEQDEYELLGRVATEPGCDRSKGYCIDLYRRKNKCL